MVSAGFKVIFYFYLIKVRRVGFFSFLNYLIPLIETCSSVVLFDKETTTLVALGSLIILIDLFVVRYYKTLRKSISD